MIVTNDRIGGQEAARHLAKLGHTRIAVIAGRRSFRSARERRAGFEDGLAEFDISIPPEYILQGDYTFESGLALGAEILDLDPPPTAVFASNDEMAAGCFASIARRRANSARRVVCRWVLMILKLRHEYGRA